MKAVSIISIVFVIAVLYILSGILQLAGNSSYKTFYYIAAVLNIIWYVAYIVLMQVDVVPMKIFLS